MIFKKHQVVKFIIFAFFAVSVCGFSSSVSAQEKSEKPNAKLAKQAKISMEKAREIALTKEPKGKIEDAELEKEHGKLVYSFAKHTTVKRSLLKSFCYE